MITGVPPPVGSLSILRRFFSLRCSGVSLRACGAMKWAHDQLAGKAQAGTKVKLERRTFAENQRVKLMH